eukprot:scaffold1219_cov400-Prasinococcus_capsulatus_cf.AAC.6
MSPSEVLNREASTSPVPLKLPLNTMRATTSTMFQLACPPYSSLLRTWATCEWQLFVNTLCEEPHTRRGGLPAPQLNRISRDHPAPSPSPVAAHGIAPCSARAGGSGLAAGEEGHAATSPYQIFYGRAKGQRVLGRVNEVGPCKVRDDALAGTDAAVADQWKETGQEAQVAPHQTAGVVPGPRVHCIQVR